MRLRSVILRRLLAKEKHEPAEWRQSTTDFHRDWSQAENKGDSIKWKQGLSFGEREASAPRRKAEVAPRRKRASWLIVLLIVGAIVYGVIEVPEMKAIAIVLFEKMMALL